jgi:hypothetical protein
MQPTKQSNSFQNRTEQSKTVAQPIPQALTSLVVEFNVLICIQCKFTAAQMPSSGICGTSINQCKITEAGQRICTSVIPWQQDGVQHIREAVVTWWKKKSSLYSDTSIVHLVHLVCSSETQACPSLSKGSSLYLYSTDSFYLHLTAILNANH